MAGARQVIGAQLIAHDEQDVFDLAHEVSSLDDAAAGRFGPGQDSDTADGRFLRPG
jgi:hypothetical protein